MWARIELSLRPGGQSVDLITHQFHDQGNGLQHDSEGDSQVRSGYTFWKTAGSSFNIASILSN